MEKISSRFQEIIFSTSDKKESAKLSAYLKEGLIRKIAPRIYTSNLDEEPEKIIRRNWYKIIAHLYPDALLSHRSALEFKPTPEGHIFLTYSYTKNINIPGLTIHFLEGEIRIEGDNRFFDDLYASQEARAFLENMQSSRLKGEESKTLPQDILEERLEAMIRAKGEEGINALRDRAREIAPELSMEKEFKKLNQLISDILATGSPKNLKSSAAIARTLGEPIDPDRIQLFESLYETLAGEIFPEYKEPNPSIEG